MRAFCAFMGLLLLGLAAMALLAYPAWQLLDGQFPFHRVGSRIGMLALLVGFVLLARRLGLADRASLGYGVPRRQFLRELATGLALGVLVMLPVVAAMLALDLRALRPGVTLDAATFLALALKGLTSGLAVAFIEETFLRGAMYTAVARESGARAAVALTALVYSAIHFIGKHRIPPEQVEAWSGFELLAGALASFADPLAMADAFLSLAAVGAVLGLIRHLRGNIAACVGLHAGWVWVITFLRETSTRDESSEFAFLLSRFDGVVGWLVLGWTVAMGLWLYRFYRRAAPAGAAAAIIPRRGE